MTQMNSRFNMMTAPPIGLDPNAQGLGLQEKQVELQRQQVQGGLGMAEKQFGLEQRRVSGQEAVQQHQMALSLREFDNKVTMDKFQMNMQKEQSDFIRRMEQQKLGLQEKEFGEMAQTQAATRAELAQRMGQQAKTFPLTMQGERERILTAQAQREQAETMTTGEQIRQVDSQLDAMKSYTMDQMVFAQAARLTRDKMVMQRFWAKAPEKFIAFAQEQAAEILSLGQARDYADMAVLKPKIDPMMFAAAYDTGKWTEAAKAEMDRAQRAGETPNLPQMKPEEIEAYRKVQAAFAQAIKDQSLSIAAHFGGPAAAKQSPAAPTEVRTKQVEGTGLSPAEQIELQSLEEVKKRDLYRFEYELGKPKRLAELRARPPARYENLPPGEQPKGAPPVVAPTTADPVARLKEGFRKLLSETGSFGGLNQYVDLAISATFERDSDLKAQWDNALDTELPKTMKVQLLRVLQQVQLANAMEGNGDVRKQIQQVLDTLTSKASYVQADLAVRNPAYNSLLLQSSAMNGVKKVAMGEIDASAFDADLAACAAADNAWFFAAQRRLPSVYTLNEQRVRLRTAFNLKYEVAPLRGVTY